MRINDADSFGGLDCAVSAAYSIWRRWENAQSIYLRTVAEKALPSRRFASIELPTHFNFVINLRVAKALAMTIPPVVMVQATNVIQ